MQDSASSLDSRASIRKASSSQSIREDVKKALDGKGKKLMVRAIKAISFCMEFMGVESVYSFLERLPVKSNLTLKGIYC